jgi:hypothetical protein
MFGAYIFSPYHIRSIVAWTDGKAVLVGTDTEVKRLWEKMSKSKYNGVDIQVLWVVTLSRLRWVSAFKGRLCVFSVSHHKYIHTYVCMGMFIW